MCNLCIVPSLVSHDIYICMHDILKLMIFEWLTSVICWNLEGLPYSSSPYLLMIWLSGPLEQQFLSDIMKYISVIKLTAGRNYPILLTSPYTTTMYLSNSFWQCSLNLSVKWPHYFSYSCWLSVILLLRPNSGKGTNNFEGCKVPPSL